MKQMGVDGVPPSAITKLKRVMQARSAELKNIHDDKREKRRQRLEDTLYTPVAKAADELADDPMAKAAAAAATPDADDRADDTPDKPVAEAATAISETTAEPQSKKTKALDAPKSTRDDKTGTDRINYTEYADSIAKVRCRLRTDAPRVHPGIRVTHVCFCVGPPSLFLPRYQRRVCSASTQCGTLCREQCRSLDPYHFHRDVWPCKLSVVLTLCCYVVRVDLYRFIFLQGHREKVRFEPPSPFHLPRLI